MIAYDQWKAGKSGAAGAALTSAAKYAGGDMKKRVTNNRAVLEMGKGQISVFEGLGAQPPEAMVNLGILLDQQGKREGGVRRLGQGQGAWCVEP